VTEWAGRYADGTRWEDGLAERLRAWGWIVSPFGQGQLDGSVTRALAAYRDQLGRPAGIRWLPDLIAVRRDALCLIDAKTSTGDHDSYKVECAAVDVHTVISYELSTPVVYVWEDGGVLTPAEVRAHYWQRYALDLSPRGPERLATW
jgi:hypothetical protein